MTTNVRWDRKLPPPDIKPPRLFRLLLRLPRPRWPIDFPLPGYSGGGLFVRGLNVLDDGAAVDSRDPEAPVESVSTAITAEYMAASIEDGDGELLFDSPAHAKRMSAALFDAFAESMWAGLAVISPSQVLSNRAAWGKALEAGASAPFNIMAAHAMADCADYLVTRSVHPIRHPERYFGIPPARLTDGQILAYWAGVDVAKRLRNER